MVDFDFVGTRFVTCHYRPSGTLTNGPLEGLLPCCVDHSPVDPGGQRVGLNPIEGHHSPGGQVSPSSINSKLGSRPKIKI